MTHTENSIDAGIVAAVAHREPVEHKEHDVDVFPTEEKIIVTVMVIVCICIYTCTTYWLTGG